MTSEMLNLAIDLSALKPETSFLMTQLMALNNRLPKTRPSKNDVNVLHKVCGFVIFYFFYQAACCALSEIAVTMPLFLC